MDLVSVSSKLKDKRNRVLERETNELKDELCAMRHIVHLLDNIKRVSSDCIQFLHLMVDAAIRTDTNQLDQLRDDVQELEAELKTWEDKYQRMASMQTSTNSSMNFDNNNDSIKSNANNETTTDDNEPTGGADGDEELSPNGDHQYYEDSDRNEELTHSSSHNSMVLMPQELCEMSMETNDTDQVVITSGETSPQPMSRNTGSPSLLASDLTGLSSGKSLFECDWIGCDFRTNMRQRLVMHKRLHSGEQLFSCDVPGCGYQSNYKGNIKIHKKHRHRIDSDDSKEYSTHSSLNNSHTSTHSTHTSVSNLSHHLLTKNNNFSSNMIRKRKRKKFRFTMNRTIGKTGGLAREAADPDDQSAKDDQISSLFTCTVKGCNYRSKWKQCLTAHQLLHAGVKPFKCDHPGCNYRTNFKGNVNVHKRVHRESQYQCQVNGCHFTTPWKNSFNQHQRNHQMNSTEGSLNIDNNIEAFDEPLSDENDFDGLDDEDSMGDDLSDPIDPIPVTRKLLLPVIPVQHIRNSSTNDLIATQHNSEMNSIQTNAQTLVPTLVGVIKTIKSEN